MKAVIKKNAVVPVLFAFFIMGFCDIVGFSTSYIKEDFGLSEALAGFIPSMLFIWFLILAVPAALVMNRIGRKKTVQVSNIITIVGLLLPVISWSFASCLAAFMLIGIGNTILQVSLNPLMTNVVKGDKLTSSLTAGQVVKAVSSFCGPFVAAGCAALFGSWHAMFAVYAVVTLISWALLYITGIEQEPLETEKFQMSAVTGAFKLLKDPAILLFFLGIFFVVGVDVGTNTVSAKLLMERCGLAVEKAAFGSSVYFICRTVGAFLGTFLLARMDEIKYLKVNLVCGMVAVCLLFFAQSMGLICVGLGGTGFFCASVFSILFSQALKARPEKANEISGFMIAAICGGAVIPPLMGFATQAVGNQNGSVLIIALCMVYLLFCAWKCGAKKAEA